MANDIKEFKNDKEGKVEAKKWGKTEAEAWENQMNKSEKAAVTDYIADKKNLKKEYEVSTFIPSEHLEDQKRKDYENLNKGMKKASTSSGVVSYHYMTKAEIGSSQDIFSSDKQVKEKALADFKTQFKGKDLLLDKILDTHLTTKDTVQEDRIILAITTPSSKGNTFKPNNGVNLSKEDPNLLVDSSYKIHVDNVTEIKVKGKECIKLTGTVVNNLDFKSDGVAAGKWGEKTWGKWANELSAEELRDLNGYMKQDYKTINPYLREGKYDSEKPETEKNETDKKIESISDALGKEKVPQSLTVYRWCAKSEWNYKADWNTDRKQFETDWIGKERILDAFTSTSLISNSVQFASPRSIVVRLNMSKGTKAGYVESSKFDGFKGEHELILDKGQTIQVNRVTEVVVKGKKKLVVDAELIQPK